MPWQPWNSAYAVALAFLSALSVRAATQSPPLWQSLNPGGGRVSGIFPAQEPNHFFAWVEGLGLFRSDSLQHPWAYLGITQNDLSVLSFAVDPSQGGRFYLGTRTGMQISTNGGLAWERIRALEGPPTNESVGLMALHGADSKLVFAAPSWGVNDSSATSFGTPLSGNRVLYRSSNRGAQWKKIIFAPSNGYRQVFSLMAPANDIKTVFIAADAGLFRSNDTGLTFETFAAPLTATGGHCRGAALSSDGKTVYAFFGVQFEEGVDEQKSFHYTSATHLFASPTQGLPKWQDLTPTWGDSAHAEMALPFGKPAFDPNSTANQHRLVFASLTGDSPLYEINVTVSASSFEAVITKLLENRPKVTPRLPNRGWSNAPGQCSPYVFAPTTWKNRNLLVASGPTLYHGQPSQPTLWSPLTTVQKRTFAASGTALGDTLATYAGLGLEAFRTSDVAAAGHYFVQTQAEQGLLESWDSGQSWCQRVVDTESFSGSVSGRPAAWARQGDAALFIPGEPGLMLAGITTEAAAAGGPDNGFLLGLQILQGNPRDIWRPLAGGDWAESQAQGNGQGTQSRGGLPRTRPFDIACNPYRPHQVAVATAQGPYLIDDITDLFGEGGASVFRSVGAGGPENKSLKRIFFDPNDSACLWVLAASGTWRGLPGLNGAYVWTRLHDASAGGSDAEDMAVWSFRGETLVAISGLENRKPVVWLRRGNRDWTRIFSAEAALLLPDREGRIGLLSPARQWVDTAVEWHFESLVGLDSSVLVGLGSRGKQRRGLGLYRGILAQTDSMQWRDWTGSGQDFRQRLPFPQTQRLRIHQRGNKAYLLAATSGMGLWSRSLMDGESPVGFRLGKELAKPLGHGRSGSRYPRHPLGLPYNPVFPADPERRLDGRLNRRP